MLFCTPWLIMILTRGQMSISQMGRQCIPEGDPRFLSLEIIILGSLWAGSDFPGRTVNIFIQLLPYVKYLPQVLLKQCLFFSSSLHYFCWFLESLIFTSHWLSPIGFAQDYCKIWLRGGYFTPSSVILTLVLPKDFSSMSFGTYTWQCWVAAITLVGGCNGSHCDATKHGHQWMNPAEEEAVQEKHSKTVCPTSLCR